MVIQRSMRRLTLFLNYSCSLSALLSWSSPPALCVQQWQESSKMFTTIFREREKERESDCMGACVLSLASLSLCGCCHMLLWAFMQNSYKMCSFIWTSRQKWCRGCKSANCCHINVLTKKGWQGDFLPPSLPLIPVSGSLLQFHFSLLGGYKGQIFF